MRIVLFFLLFLAAFASAANSVDPLTQVLTSRLPSLRSLIVGVGVILIGVAFLYGGLYLFIRLIKDNLGGYRTANRWRDDMRQRNYYRLQDKFYRRSSFLRSYDDNFRNYYRGRSW